ncbi:hypothetical protein GCM10023082_42730 [Streptomyces tremellae]|uniref:Transposase n=1 Tax=Streptomyces tremellae TaxID=1124239 RepID=A0ABP7FLP5_9ACTN
MSVQPREPATIPADTVRVARAAFPRGSPAIRVRDELGPWFRDEEFADLFPARGKPAWSPGRLALVLVLQSVEGLTDRQAAEAVRARIDFKYALGLERHHADRPGPLAISPQTAAGDGLTGDDFTIDWVNEQVRCPGGRKTTRWNPDRSPEGTPVIRVRFNKSDCPPCPVRGQCATSSVGRRLTLRPREEHEALRQARADQDTGTWKERCTIRAGVEGAISQGVRRWGLRRSRFRGLAKTSLQHQLTGAATNLARIDTHLTDTPRARTRTRTFATLRPAEPMLGGAK